MVLSSKYALLLPFHHILLKARGGRTYPLSRLQNRSSKIKQGRGSETVPLTCGLTKAVAVSHAVERGHTQIHSQPSWHRIQIEGNPTRFRQAATPATAKPLNPSTSLLLLLSSLPNCSVWAHFVKSSSRCGPRSPAQRPASVFL